MPKSVTPFLMFDGEAEEAMTFYVSLFDDARVESIQRYDADGPGAPGSVMQAAFTLAGQAFLCIDSPAKHDFDFTPSFSIFIDCESEGELERLFSKLSDGGQVLMPLDNYGFSRRFGWLNDRFDVSWQLNLA